MGMDPPGFTSSKPWPTAPSRSVTRQRTSSKKRQKRPAARVVDGSVLARVQGAVAARPAGACPLCGTGAAETEVAIGPVFVKLCSECTKPLFHMMGLLEFFKR